MVDAQTIGVLVTAASVTVAAIYYVMNLRISQRNQELSLRALEQSAKAQQMTLDTRQAQLLMNIYQKWTEPEFEAAWTEIVTKWKWSDYDDYQAKYGLANPEYYRKSSMVAMYFEGIGVLVKNGFIDARLVEDLGSVYIVGFWQKLEPIYREFRVRMNSPTTVEFVEYLYDVIYPIWLEQHPGTPRPISQ